MVVASYESVEQTYEWFAQIQDDHEVNALIEQFSSQQPVLFAYIMTMGEGDFDGPEQELLLFLGLVIWKTFLNTGNTLQTLGDDHLNAVQEQNMAMLEYLADENEEGFMQVAETLMLESSQPHLLRFLVEVIFEDESDIIRTTNQGIMFIFLKIVVDSISISLVK